MERGIRLGPYEVQEQLGAGGMGEVYLAQDTRLHRKVAVKVLPAEFASDPARLARFEQEARAAAALNHPNIAVVHDFGVEDGTHYMVQELLQGQSLRDELQAGPLEYRRALKIATEVATALRAAHGAGIVHRDLKPENIFVTAEGHAKVLDFGLAKLAESGTTPSSGLTQSPTSLGTAAGMVMGTAGYMAPEQARGEPVDARADLFAVGCVLYEALGGRRAFDGESVIQVLNRVLHEEAPALETRDPIPAELQRIIDKCLKKNLEERYQGAADLVVDLRALPDSPPVGAKTEAVDPAAGPAALSGAGLQPVVVGAAVLVASLVGAVLGSTFLADTDAPAEQSVLRFTVPTPELQFRGYSAGLHFTPDGRTLAYHGENLELRLRDLSTWEARSVPGTANSRDGFLSPDGRWFAYMNSSEGTLDKVLLDGGTPVTLVRGIGIFNSGAWSGDGVLYFTGGVDGQVDLWRLDEDGSNLRPVIETEPTAGKSFYGQLQLLPGDEALLVTRVPDELEASGAEVEDAQVWALVLDDLSFKPLIEGASQARYLPGGYLAVLMAGGSLSVVEFDLEAIEVRGTPRRVVDAIRQNDGYINGRWTVSASGSLAYVAPPEAVEPGRLLWVEPDGSLSTAVEVPRTTRAGFSYDARLGPAGRTVALSLAGTSGRVNVWLLDVERGTGAPFLPGQSWESFSPSWSPDGTRLAFVRATSMFRGGDVKVAPVDGSAPAQTIYQSPDDDGDIVVRDLSLGNWTPDGNRLCFTQTSPRGRSDIWVADTTPGGSSEMVVGTEADEVSPQFSPDGGWLAYSSNVTGRMEVYLRAYPQGSRDIPVSRNGGEAPVWSPDGTRLYYREGSVLVAVDTDLRGGNGSAVQIGRAVSLAELPPGIDADYTVDRDSGRILLAQGTRIPDAEEIHVILGFADEIHAGALGRDP